MLPSRSMQLSQNDLLKRSIFLHKSFNKTWTRYAHTTHSTHVALLLAHRLRRWHNIKPTLV